MKFNKLILMVVCVVSIFAHGCGGGSSPAPTATTPALQPVATPIQVQVVDGTGTPVTDTVFTLTITGTNAAAVVDSLNGAITTLPTTQGAALLTLASGTVLPATFNVMVSGVGYLPTGKTVTVSAPGAVAVPVPVVKLVTGTGVAQGGGFTVSPILNTAVGVNGNVTVTPSGAVSPVGLSTIGMTFASPATTSNLVIDTQAQLAIPAGVTMTDKNGLPINGTLTANVVSYSPTSNSALAAFPGGLAAGFAAISGQTTTTTSGSFVSAGFVAFNLVDSSGNVVKYFGTQFPVTATITVPSTTKNPDGTPLVVTQSMPIWSYDETLGTWVAELGGTVTGNDPYGNYLVSFTVTHLSYWTTGLFYSASAVCDATVRVILPSGATRVDLSAEIIGSDGFLSEGYADNSTAFTVRNAPKNKPFEITMSVPGATSTLTQTVPDMCVSGGVLLDASGIRVPTLGSVKGKVFEACFRNGVEAPNTRRALEDAKVTLVSNSFRYRTLETDGDGTYNFKNVPAGSVYTVSSFSPRLYDALPVLHSGSKSDLTVTAGAITSVSDFVFPMQCVVRGTGATGGSD